MPSLRESNRAYVTLCLQLCTTEARLHALNTFIGCVISGLTLTVTGQFFVPVLLDFPADPGARSLQLDPNNKKHWKSHTLPLHDLCHELIVT